MKKKSIFYIAANRGRMLLGFLQVVSSNFKSENSNVAMVFVAGLLALDCSGFLQWLRIFS